jgi:hypothetical protein
VLIREVLEEIAGKDEIERCVREGPNVGTILV